MVASEGEWYRVEFHNPQWGRRNFYIEKRHVKMQWLQPLNKKRLMSALQNPGCPHQTPSSRHSGKSTMSRASLVLVAFCRRFRSEGNGVGPETQPRGGFWRRLWRNYRLRFHAETRSLRAVEWSQRRRRRWELTRTLRSRTASALSSASEHCRPVRSSRILRAALNRILWR